MKYAPYPKSVGGSLGAPMIIAGGGGTPQWFYIQTLSQNSSGGGTSTQYNGPFYGNPQDMGGLLQSSENILTYYNGKWSQYLFN